MDHRLEAMMELKTVISKKLHEITDIFTTFQVNHQPDIKTQPVFNQGAQFYCDLTKPFLVEME